MTTVAVEYLILEAAYGLSWQTGRMARKLSRGLDNFDAEKVARHNGCAT